ncbi:hypothetical protein Tco_1211248 [Tanacetum coccineum]
MDTTGCVVCDAHDPQRNEVDIPDDEELVDFIEDDEDEPEEETLRKNPKEDTEPNNGHGNQFAQHPNPQPDNMNGWLEEDDDMNENVNDEDIEDEDVKIEVDDDAEDESSDSEPPNAESSDFVLSDSESEDEEHVLGDVLERLKVLESRENATSKKKLVEAEMKLELARMEHDMVERRLHASYGWNKRFYMEMVRIGAVPKPPSC